MNMRQEGVYVPCTYPGDTAGEVRLHNSRHAMGTVQQHISCRVTDAKKAARKSLHRVTEREKNVSRQQNRARCAATRLS